MLALVAVAALLPLGLQAQTAPLTADQAQLREIYQQLVEINTTDSAGSCTAAVTAMAAHLKAGGYSDAEMQLIVPPDGPKKGNLVVRLKGSGASKPLLLLAHVDVVEAKRADWTRDPFKLIEENGVFYARGASDDKAMASVFVANMIRYKREKFAGKRDVIMALTCDEEIIPSKFNGVEYLLKHHRNLIDAELAFNEGGTGFVDKDDKPLYLTIQLGEKVYQTYQLEVTSAGGHSARAPRDNAISHLADGLSRLGKFEFPFSLSPATRAYYERMATVQTGQTAADMQAMLRDPPDRAALDRLYTLNAEHNSTVRTTCVATMVDAGHAMNALAVRASATVNCRILPGQAETMVRETLVRVLADERIEVTPVGEAVLSPSPPMTPALMRAVDGVTREMWPGLPVVPILFVASSDGRYLNNAGIWTYGVSGMFHGPEANGVHAVNEHLRVRSLYNGQQFLYRLVKDVAQQ